VTVKARGSRHGQRRTDEAAARSTADISNNAIIAHVPSRETALRGREIIPPVELGR
jgi:hypothetical protein